MQTEWVRGMPAWMIETFGNRDMTLLFWGLALAPAPWWVAMIFLPPGRSVERWASPWVWPGLFTVPVVLLLGKLLEYGASPPAEVDYAGARTFLQHPLVFLMLWAGYQAGILFVGMSVYREARRVGIRASVELLLVWLLGPVGLAVFAVRRMLSGR